MAEKCIYFYLPRKETKVNKNTSKFCCQTLIADKILPENESVRINFDGDVENCLYDIKAVFKDGSYQEAYKIDLCEVSEVTL